jgi:cyanophycinase-like exopeptidase
MKKTNILNILAIIFLQIIFLSQVYSQGKIMIVGGGTENYNDWSNIPYSWAVNNSENKRVAIVGHGSATTWLPNYFLSLGATAAKNFLINSGNANSQATYDSLMTYDVIFFRGGNQANYYNSYRNTKTTEAVTDKFNSGGVIAGTSAGLHILSGVVFTAQNGTAYSDDCIKNIFHIRITLKDDFLQIMPGYIFDSHFVERGRLGRLLAFMARWKHDHDEDLIGIGVDDMTAFCIDASDPDNVMGYAYGTAAVNIYRGGEFGHQDSKLHVQGATATQLLHGCTINLGTFEVSGFSSQMSVSHTVEHGNYTLLLSGSDPVSENQEFINYFINSLGEPGDPVLIITGNNTSLANAYQQAFTQAGASTVNIGQAIAANNSSPDLQNLIEQSGKIVFLGNSYQTLYTFVNSGAVNGNLLQDKITADGARNAFVGDNSRFAGAWAVSDNYLTNANASFNGQLSFNPGLNLLSTMAIMPNTYLYETTYWENTNSALPYAMLEEQVHRGVWLTVRNFMKYYTDEATTLITVYGESPAMILTSQDGGYDLNAKIFRNRQVGGFENMDFQTLLHPHTLEVGLLALSAKPENIPNSIEIFFEPDSRQLVIHVESLLPETAAIGIYDLNGRLLLHENRSLILGQNRVQMKMPGVKPGIYLLKFQSGNVFTSRKIMVLH